MHLAFAMLADFAEATPDGKVTIGGGDFDSIVAPAFPAVHTRTIALVVRFIVDPAESEAPHTFRVEFTDPQGNTWIPPVKAPYSSLRTRGASETPAKFAFVFNFSGLVFPTPGRYLIRLFLDEDTEPIGSLPLHALVQSAPSSGQRQTTEEVKAS